MKETPYFCECHSFDCLEVLPITERLYRSIKDDKPRCSIISSNCKTTPKEYLAAVQFEGFLVVFFVEKAVEKEGADAEKEGAD